MALDDDEVTEWTASFDEQASTGSRLIAVAAGNDGQLSPKLNRVQPPADGVNVLSIGAVAARDGKPVRASYSCCGPGRCPGIIKPDGVMFGGSDTSAFGILDSGLGVLETCGTSFAAPFALRSAAAIHAQLGSQLQFTRDNDNLMPLVIRALLIHRAKPPLTGKRSPKENWGGDVDVGWGLIEEDSRRLITCDDDEALTIYRGELPVGQYLRADVPMPDAEVQADISIVATLLIATDINPENVGNYTRNGLEITFRPDGTTFIPNDIGETGPYPASDRFFPATRTVPEYQLKVDGKWEPCRRQGKKYAPGKLKNPYFHIYYHHRHGLGKDATPKPIPYVFVVSVKADGINDFYNMITTKYSHILTPLKPMVDITIPLPLG
jgi:hypothetical protein